MPQMCWQTPEFLVLVEYISKVFMKRVQDGNGDLPRFENHIIMDFVVGALAAVVD
jgi:hypothetical protein